MINSINFGISIGDDRDASSITLLKRHNITAILDLTGLHIDMNLDEEAIKQVEKAVNELERLWINHYNILIHCHGGIDRAPFIVALWLSRYWNRSFQECYDVVKEKRPQTIQHYEWYSHFR